MKYPNSIDPGLLIRNYFPDPDYCDVYEASFSSPQNLSPGHIVKAFFNTMPSGASMLLAVREKAAKLVGLQTGRGKEATLKEVDAFQGKPGDKIAVFEVWDRTAEELLTGKKDKHLDFGLSFLLEKQKDHYTFRLITAVRIHNIGGRVYFAIVKPFHKLIMAAIVRRIKNDLMKSAQRLPLEIPGHTF